ncbi:MULTISPECIES: hypothetical protein [Aurantimonas]|uniref:hypothetical protein n=1 Tax=Aurantimonas TaxID=182269 RepID=UPI00351531A7
MAAKNVTNHHYGPMSVGGVTIPAGRTAAVARWDAVKGSSTIKTWLKLKVISVDGDIPTPQDPAVVNDPDVTGGAYSVKQTSPGWFAVFQGDEQVTKGLRKDDVSGFDEFSDADKTAFVEANKAED